MPPDPEAPAAACSQAVVDAERKREQLRDAGKKYFQQALEANAKGQAFNPDKACRTDVQEDEDVKAFGRVLKALKPWALGAMYVGASAASPVLIKGSLYSMQTPAVLLFLHMLALVLALWHASSFGVFKLDQLTPQGFKGASVRVTLGSLQMLCMFSALHHNSVNFVLCWMLVGGELVQAGLRFITTGKKPEGELRLLYMVATGAAVLEFLVDKDKVWVGFLMMVAWTGLKALERGWAYVKDDPSLGGRVPGFRVTGFLREVAEEEEALSPASLVFLGHVLPAVPVLLLGFLALEGRELVNHELSVPAVEVMLLACACYVVANCCELLLEGKISADTKLLLHGAACAGTIVMFFLEEIKTIRWAGVLLTAVACGAAFVASRRCKP